MALLEISKVSKSFHVRNAAVAALSEVDLSVEAGETFGLIGESGSGKSTLGRIAVGLMSPDQGTVTFDGQDIIGMTGRALQRLRSQFQVVFQEPFESLNPRMRVAAIVAEPIAIHEPSLNRKQRRERVIATLELVGLNESLASRFPGELSGGQQQRVGIARAIATSPRLVILDEPTSSLDVSVRAVILRLLADLRSQLGLAYLFISHDISTINHFCSRVAVMYQGRVVETGPASRVLSTPSHPYTAALLSASLAPDPRIRNRHAPLGERPLTRPDARRECVLTGRCPIEIDACSQGPVELTAIEPGHRSACVRGNEAPAILAGLGSLPMAKPQEK